MPLALLLHTLFANVHTDAVLLASLPLADVLAAVCPHEGALTLALVVDEVALVLLSVLPGENTLAVHFVLCPVAGVALAVRPVVISVSADLVLLKLPLVVGSVREGQPAVTLLLPLDVLTLVPGTVRPRLHTVTVLLIVEPLALVISSIRVRVCSLALSFIVGPLALVDVTIGVDQLALTVGFVVSPLTFVARAIRPQLGAETVTHAHQPLARVNGTILESEGSLGYAPVLIDLLTIADALARCRTLQAHLVVLTFRLISRQLTVGLLEVVVLELQVPLVEAIFDLLLRLVLAIRLPIAVACTVPHFSFSNMKMLERTQLEYLKRYGTLTPDEQAQYDSLASTKHRVSPLRTRPSVSPLRNRHIEPEELDSGRDFGIQEFYKRSVSQENRQPRHRPESEALRSKPIVKLDYNPKMFEDAMTMSQGKEASLIHFLQ